MRPRGNIGLCDRWACAKRSPAGAWKLKAGRPSGREGWIHLTFAREKNGGRRDGSDRNAESEDISTPMPKSKKKRGDTPEVGQALRSVYQRTVEEDIPPDLLDLLGKLG
jgi:hypothetical protein